MDKKPLPVLIYHPGILGHEIIEYILRHKNVPSISIPSLSDRTVMAVSSAKDEKSKDLLHKINVVRRTIELSRGTSRWKVITFIREPFSNADDICNWFDTELKERFGFDVYSIPYDKSKGFQIYQTEHADILLFKLEHFMECYRQAFSVFLNLSVPQLQVNMESYRQIYNQMRRNIELPISSLQQLYTMKCVLHFYTREEILKFVEGWYGEPQPCEAGPMAAFSDGRICFADKGMVRRFGESGEIEGIEVEVQPEALAVAGDSRLYIGFKDHVQVYEDVKKVAIWPGLGEKALITNIVTDGPDVFVADAGNEVVIRYDMNGNLIDRTKVDMPDVGKCRNKRLSPYYSLSVDSNKKPEMIRHQVPKPYKRIYQYHIHKSGGTSINFAIFSMGNDPGNNVYNALNNSSSGAIVSNGISFANWKRPPIEQGDYFYAHSHSPMHRLNIPPETFTFAIFREPINRLISQYRHLREIQIKKPQSNAMKTEGRWLGNSFSDFIRNLPKEQMLHQTYFFSAKYDVDEAVENIAKCSFFFFTEEFKEGVDELSSRLGFKIELLHVRESKIDVGVTEADREFLYGTLKKEYDLIEKLRRHPSYWRHTSLQNRSFVGNAEQDNVFLPV